MKNQRIDRMGVMVLVAHLIITLAMICAYVLFTWLDKSTSAIENMLLIAVGFWFSTFAQNANNRGTTIQANEVKVNPPSENKEV